MVIIGITNQGGVAAGFKTLEDTIAEQKRTLQLAPVITAIFLCPDGGESCWLVPGYQRKVEQYLHEQMPIIHLNDGSKMAYPKFRKPDPGMLWLAIDKMGEFPFKLPDEILMVGGLLRSVEDGAQKINKPQNQYKFPLSGQKIGGKIESMCTGVHIYKNSLICKLFRICLSVPNLKSRPLCMGILARY